MSLLQLLLAQECAYVHYKLNLISSQNDFNLQYSSHLLEHQSLLSFNVEGTLKLNCNIETLHNIEIGKGGGGGLGMGMGL